MSNPTGNSISSYSKVPYCFLQYESPIEQELSNQVTPLFEKWCFEEQFLIEQEKLDFIKQEDQEKKEVGHEVSLSEFFYNLFDSNYKCEKEVPFLSPIPHQNSNKGTSWKRKSVKLLNDEKASKSLKRKIIHYKKRDCEEFQKALKEAEKVVKEKGEPFISHPAYFAWARKNGYTVAQRSNCSLSSHFIKCSSRNTTEKCSEVYLKIGPQIFKNFSKKTLNFPNEKCKELQECLKEAPDGLSLNQLIINFKESGHLKGIGKNIIINHINECLVKKEGDSCNQVYKKKTKEIFEN